MPFLSPARWVERVRQCGAMGRARRGGKHDGGIPRPSQPRLPGCDGCISVGDPSSAPSKKKFHGQSFSKGPSVRGVGHSTDDYRCSTDAYPTKQVEERHTAYPRRRSSSIWAFWRRRGICYGRGSCNPKLTSDGARPECSCCQCRGQLPTAGTPAARRSAR